MMTMSRRRNREAAMTNSSGTDRRHNMRSHCHVKIIALGLILGASIPVQSFLVGVETINQPLQTRHHSTFPGTKPSSSSTTVTLNMGSSASSTTSDEKSLLQKQRSRIRGNQPLISLNLNLDSLAKQNAPYRAQELLERIIKLHDCGYYEVSPDAVSYNSVLNAWARSSQPDSVEQALALFKDMNVEPTLATFNTLLLVLAKHGYPEQAQELLDYMKSASDNSDGTGRLELLPDTISYNSVIYAWASSADAMPRAALNAESILREMTRLTHEQMNPHVKPDTISFNTVLNAWSNHKTGGRAEQDGDNNTVSSSSLSSSSALVHPGQRAQELLHHMEELYQAGNEDVEPDVYSYTSVIKAWGNVRDEAGCTRALDLLERMETLATEQDRPNVHPNPHTYACCITVLANHGRAQQAHELLQHLIQRYEQTGNAHYKPDTVVFSAVIQGWAQLASSGRDTPLTKSNVVTAADRALGLLLTMKRLSKHPDYGDDIAPNAYTYTSVLKALSKSGDRKTMADTAEQLLQELQQTSAIQASTIHYNAVLNVIAQSSSHDKAIRAQRLLSNMSKCRYCQPDVITFNAVLLACANSFGWDTTKRKALSIALETYQELLQAVEPNSCTYAFVIKAIRKLVPPSEARHSVLQKAFRECSERGLVNEFVLKQVHLSCTDEQRNKLFRMSKRQNGRVRAKDLPEEWSCRCEG